MTTRNIGQCLEDHRDVVLELAADVCQGYATFKGNYDRAYGSAGDWRHGCADTPDFLHELTALSLGYANQLARLGSAYSALACRGLASWYATVTPPNVYAPGPTCLSLSGAPKASARQRVILSNAGNNEEQYKVGTVRLDGGDELVTRITLDKASEIAPTEVTIHPGERRSVLVDVELPDKAGDHCGYLCVTRDGKPDLRFPVQIRVIA